MMTRGQKSSAVRQWNGGRSAAGIAEHLGVTLDEINVFLSKRVGYPGKIVNNEKPRRQVVQHAAYAPYAERPRVNAPHPTVGRR